MRSIGHVVGGKPLAGASGRTAPVYNPATGEQSGEVQLAGAAEVSDVVKVAADAATTWGQSSLSTRAAALFKLRELLDAHRDELAALVTSEHGKVHSDALGEVARGLECVEFACGI